MSGTPHPVFDNFNYLLFGPSFVIITCKLIFIMICDAVFVVSFQAAHKLILAVFPDKPGKGADPGIVKHAPGTGKLRTFPTAVQVPVMATLVIPAPFPVFTGAAPAAYT